MSKIISVLSVPLFGLALTASLALGQASDKGRGPGTHGNSPQSHNVPEVNAHGLPAALALVLGGVAVVLGRRTRRREDKHER